MLSATQLRKQTYINACQKLYEDIAYMADYGFQFYSFLTNEHKLELELLGYTVDVSGASGPNIFRISWENPTNQNDHDTSAAKMYAKAYAVAYKNLVDRITAKSHMGSYSIDDVTLTRKMRDQLESLGYSVSPYGSCGAVSISWS